MLTINSINETLNLLDARIGNLGDFRVANKIIFSLTGISDFFYNESEYLDFKTFIQSDRMNEECSDRREFGDFQTPSSLTDAICSYLLREGISPDVVIEPTFGKGSFLLSALSIFPDIKIVIGNEIFKDYCLYSKFKLFDFFVHNQHVSRPKIFLFREDIFKFNIKNIIALVENKNILILGNPPWVTNSELGCLEADNLPKKRNFKLNCGLDAMTGKGNFDIGEYIVLLILHHFSQFNGQFAMLVKNAVIRNIVHELPKLNFTIHNLKALNINAKAVFGASVEASLMTCTLGRAQESLFCSISSFDTPSIVKSKFGWQDGKFISDVQLYEKVNQYDGECPYVWRQGIKHDCAKVMELDFKNGKFINGLGEEYCLEDDRIYGLLKSSDINKPVIKTTRKYLIVTQDKVGETTNSLQQKYPNLWAYLMIHADYFEKRKSTIYKDKSLFSIFGVGEYAFKPYKIAVSGLYKSPTFSFIYPQGNKAIMLDDTCYFLGFDDINEATLIWGVLNSKYVRQLLSAIVFLDAKRPYTKEVLMRIGIDSIVKNISLDEIECLIASLDEGMLKWVQDRTWQLIQDQASKRLFSDDQLCLFNNLQLNKSVKKIRFLEKIEHGVI